MSGTLMQRALQPTNLAATARRASGQRVSAGLLALVLAIAGCEAAGGPGADADADTAGGGGLSREELEQQAQPMSPERARELGIVDTTEAAPPAPIGPQSSIPGAATDTSASPTVAP